MKLHALTFGIGSFLLCVSISVTLAVTTTWTGDGDGFSWSDAANWDNGAPLDGMSAVVNAPGTNVLLASPTHQLAAFELLAGTLTFTNWNTSLSATNVLITGGILTLTLLAEMDTRTAIPGRLFSCRCFIRVEQCLKFVEHETASN